MHWLSKGGVSIAYRLLSITIYTYSTITRIRIETMRKEKIKSLKEEHEALSNIIKDARKIGVKGKFTTKWFADLKVVIGIRLDVIEVRLDILSK